MGVSLRCESRCAFASFGREAQLQRRVVHEPWAQANEMGPVKGDGQPVTFLHWAGQHNNFIYALLERMAETPSDVALAVPALTVGFPV